MIEPARLDAGPIDRARVEEFLEALVADEMGVEPDDGWWFGVGSYGLRRIFGVARLQERDGHVLLDDVWVRPEQRRHGFGSHLIQAARLAASKRGANVVWLLCDQDMVAFYAARGWEQAGADAFPVPLAELCARKGEWPAARDHVHVPMRAPARG